MGTRKLSKWWLNPQNSWCGMVIPHRRKKLWRYDAAHLCNANWDTSKAFLVFTLVALLMPASIQIHLFAFQKGRREAVVTGIALD